MRFAFVAAIAAMTAALLFFAPRSNWADDQTPPAVAGDISLPDTAGKTRSLSDWPDRKAVVLAWLGVECPNANRYLVALEKVKKDYKERGVILAGVNSNWNEQEAAKLHKEEREIKFPVLLDADHAVADKLGVQMTATVVVLDAKGAVRYRGRIDSTPMSVGPTARDLREALDAVLDGRDPEVATTPVKGCAIRRTKPAPTGEVTWSKDVAPILFQNCVQCHRAGQIGPMPLTDFAHASSFGPEILAAVKAKKMPPWKPTAGGPFVGERALSASDIETIEKWVATGTPEGDPEAVPELPKFPDGGWTLGEPDMILDSGEDFNVSLEPDLYWHFVMQNKWDEDKWVTALEIKPGNPRIVHHVLGYLDETGTAKKLDAADDELGYRGGGGFPGFVPTGEMGGWAPGQSAQALPPGVARKLKKGSTLVLQVHYNNITGKKQKDRTQIGLWFAKTPVKQQLYQARLVNPFFRIPPGAKSHEVQTTWPVSRDVEVIAVMPHAHLLGKTAKMVVETEDEKSFPLVEISDWDFKWQDTYRFVKPIRLESGSRVRLTFTYDNSPENPNQLFKPPQEIRWGEGTSEEMCLGYVNYVRVHQDLTKKKKKSGDEDE